MVDARPQVLDHNNARTHNLPQKIRFLKSDTDPRILIARWPSLCEARSSTQTWLALVSFPKATRAPKAERDRSMEGGISGIITWAYYDRYQSFKESHLKIAVRDLRN